MGWWKMFGEVIRTIGFALGPVEIELVLGNAIFEPVVTHVKSFGPFHVDLGSENIMGC
jgi:hypothetical protein